MKPVTIPDLPPETPRPLPGWLVTLLGLLLLLLCAGCGQEKLKSLLPKSLQGSDPAASKSLTEVLPGRWEIYSAKGPHMIIHFGRHSEMSFTLDVPDKYRPILKFDQFWVGGNYRVDGNGCVNIMMTDGRWAAIIAEMHGLKLNRVGVKSYGEDSVLDVEGDTWKRIGKEAEALKEARDIADDPAPGQARNATASGVPAPALAAAPVPTGAEAKRLQAARAQLATAYAKLQKRRQRLDPKNAKALAAFNKDAADYAQQVSRFSAQNNSSASGPAVGPIPPPAAPAAIPVAAAGTDAPIPPPGAIKTAER